MSADLRELSPVFLSLKNGRVISPPSDTPLVVCLGNFDGVHTAHASLLRAGLSLRDTHFPRALCGVFTFFHPSSDYSRTEFVREAQASSQEGASRIGSHRKMHRRHLTTLKEKLRLLAEQGMDFVCLCDFAKIRDLSAQAFLSLLTERLNVRGAVCGYNYHFGKGGLGTADDLRSHFDRPDNGFFCSVAPPFQLDGISVSSSYIRQLLLNGNADVAATHLGHPYALLARVVEGKKLGRTWGFPTANQNFLPESIIPAHGVYAVLCHTPKGIFPGVANVGSHPTVDAQAQVNCETHVIGPSQVLYGHLMRVEFLHRLRGEEKFDSVEALTRAIARDKEQAQLYVKDYLDHRNRPL